jgi:hypothetical protein
MVQRMMSGTLATLGKDGPELAVCARIVSVWTSIVGENLSGHLTPVRVKRGTLTIQSGSSSWLQEARFMEEALLRNLAERAPETGIERLEFQLVRGGRRARPAARESSQPPGVELEQRPLPEDVEVRIRETVDKVEDIDLRELLRNVLRLAARAELTRNRQKLG